MRPGLLGRREAFAERYCGRHLAPVFRGGGMRLRWCNTGLGHAPELHALLKQARMLSSALSGNMEHYKRSQHARCDACELTTWREPVLAEWPCWELH